MKKNIAILGSTGSIGTQTLEVVNSHPDRFRVSVLTAFNNADLLIKQTEQFKPGAIAIGNPDKFEYVKNALKGTDVEIYAGSKSIEQIVTIPQIDIVLTAMVGYSGLLPTINAISSGKDIALANKETMVVAGDLVTKLAAKHNSKIIPVDSEHSAIFQCLTGESIDEVEKIILTASGGPFLNMSFDQLKQVTKKDALNHPNWDMGDKITIDSASLMNKGLETIEAKWLFNLSAQQIEVVIHPQSIIHSLVQFHDGSIKAQMGLPDMKLPIQYALGYPERLKSSFQRFNFADYSNLTFQQPDVSRFPNLKIALHAMEMGGTAPCVMNAANEIVVDAFLHEKINFFDMPRIIEKTVEKLNIIHEPSFADYVEMNNEARSFASTLIN